MVVHVVTGIVDDGHGLVASRVQRHLTPLTRYSGLIMPYLPLYVAFFALLGLSYGFPYSNCTGKEGSPPPSTLGKTVAVTSVPPCAAAPCEVHPSEVLNLTITFVPNEVISNFTAVVHAALGTTKIPFPIPNPDGCDTSVTGVTCPLKANTPVEWKHSLTLPKLIPAGVTVVIIWELQVSAGNDVSCVEFVAKVAP
ncbi:NPC intracellular cholesterol transporter 2-like [Oscarella lobularis]|uniref:NPC intracellular cholesterol transporter 2-like n=1 Tax=Oscarella lobularis TaxID=121494 RepID=UPI003313434A